MACNTKVEHSFYVSNVGACSHLTVWTIGVEGDLGTSHRTEDKLNVKEKSAIRNHTTTDKTTFVINNFRIIDLCKDKLSLLISKSLHIKRLGSDLNSVTSAVPLLII